MDFSEHFEAIVQDLINKIQNTVNDRVLESIEQNIAKKLETFDFNSVITAAVAPSIEQRVSDLKFDTRAINQAINAVATETAASLASDLRKQVETEVHNEIHNLDVKALISDKVTETITNRLGTLTFPEASIPWAAVSLADVKLTGDAITGGIIKQFGSTGIDDQATKCQVTILDSHLVAEVPILTTGVDVRGDAAISGNLVLNGEIDSSTTGFKKLLEKTTTAVRDSLNDELFAGFSNFVATNIREGGIDFSEVLINGRLVLSESKLGPSVVNSNLKTVGELEELQVRGESYLSKTLYVSGRRVGINTLEPSSALTIWDEEVEIVAAKAKQNTGYFGTIRPATLVLGANGKENISLDIDGSVTINDLRLGALPLGTASTDPNWEGRAGEIVFNDSPAVGRPIGWVCLGGTRWAFFGTIQE